MSDKVRVHEIAKELGIVSKEVVDKANAMGMSLKTASSSVSMEEAEKIMNYIMNPEADEPKQKKVTLKKAAPKEEAAEVLAEVEKQEPKETLEASEAPKKLLQEKKTQEIVVTETIKDETSVEKTTPAVQEQRIVPKKRSGLRIVKKKKPKVQEDYTVVKTENASAVSS